MPNGFLRYSNKLSCLIAACCLLAGAAHAGESSKFGIQPRDLDFDQFIAWIPVDDAPVASVALARLNVALYTAKKRAAQSLCSGRWMANGPLYDHQEPSLQRLATGHAEKPTWFYNALRHPGPIPCENVSRARFFREMSRHLPEWVVVRPSGNIRGFRQGSAVFTEQQHLVATL